MNNYFTSLFYNI